MRGVYYSACSLCYKTIGVTKNICLLLRDDLLFRRLLLPESTVLTLEEDIVKMQRYKNKNAPSELISVHCEGYPHRDRDYIGIQSRSQSSQTCEISTTQNQSMSSFIWRLIFNRTIIYTIYSILSIHIFSQSIS